MPEVVTIGWLTLDDIVLLDGTVHQKVSGGGALYSAVGASIWEGEVGIHATTGSVDFADVRSAIGQYGIDTEGITPILGHGLELWLLHESDTDKQQVPKLASAGAQRMDDERPDLSAPYRNAKGYHLAPQSPAGHLHNLTSLRELPQAPVITMDILSDAYVDVQAYRDLAPLASLTAFLPSREEVLRIWQPESVTRWMHEVKDACPDLILVIKTGPAGSLVLSPDSEMVQWVPSFPSHVLDTTGAGDAYCGGFLAGLTQGKSAVESAAMGTVSASYVIEAFGALATHKPTAQERDERYSKILIGVKDHS
ncbi:MAG: carbohydrate kinase family protein [Deinococcota bacterium]|jgi:ribokinase|nr:carbohydrate kinase family protein [Deinococcota bacterium]